MFSASAVESVKDKTVNLVEQTEKSSQKTMEVRMTTMDLHFHASLNPLTPRVTKTEFLLTLSIQYQPDK